MNFEKLEEKLAELTGYDFETAEKACRAKGDTTPDISFSKDFQSRLAAKALKVKLDDIKKLPVNQYVSVTTKVSNFLFGSLVELVQQDR